MRRGIGEQGLGGEMAVSEHMALSDADLTQNLSHLLPNGMLSEFKSAKV